MTKGDRARHFFDSAKLTLPSLKAWGFFIQRLVTGAGDTVVTALTLGLTAGVSFWEAAVLGNLAASIIVRQFGTKTTTPTEMKAALQALLDEAVSHYYYIRKCQIWGLIYRDLFRKNSAFLIFVGVKRKVV